MLPFAATQFFSGAISDLYDRRRLVVLGLLLFSAGSWAFGFATSFAFALAARLVQGAGFGLVAPVLVAILGDIVPLERRAQSLGYFGSALTAGIALGPVLAAIFGEAHWRLTFEALGILALLSLLAFVSFFRSPVQGTAKEERGKSLIWLLLTTAFRGPVLLLCGLGFATFLGFVGILAFTADAFSQAPFDYSPALVGAILAASGISGMICAPLAGVATRRWGPRRTFVVGALGSAAAALLLSEAESELIFLLLFAAIGGTSAFLWTPLLTLVTTLIPGRRGTVSSLFNGVRFVGFALAPVLWPAVLPAPVWVWTDRIAALLFFGGFLLAGWLPATLASPPGARPLKGS